MTSERIKEIQETTTYPESVSVMLALKQVWNECEQERKYTEEDVILLLHKRDKHMNTYEKLHGGFQTPKEWFEQFKK